MTWARGAISKYERVVVKIICKIFSFFFSLHFCSLFLTYLTRTLMRSNVRSILDLVFAQITSVPIDIYCLLCYALQVGDVVLVEDETVIENEFKMIGLETLVCNNSLLPHC